MTGAVLPTLVQHPSPNQSRRVDTVPYLVCVHRPVGSYEGTLATFDNPTTDVSAHVVTGGPGGVAAQCVKWDRKAWACAAFNSATYNLEVQDDAWAIVDRTTLRVQDERAFAEAARIVAYLCKRTGIPPAWTRDPLSAPGVVRHLDLGVAGGGHSDPTGSVALWRRFVALAKSEYDRGGFRPTWGVGTLARIDT